MTRILHHIEQQRDHVLVLDIAVDAARRQLASAVEALQVAVRERDRAGIHLRHLLEMAVDQAA